MLPVLAVIKTVIVHFKKSTQALCTGWHSLVFALLDALSCAAFRPFVAIVVCRIAASAVACRATLTRRDLRAPTAAR
eukprot:1171394-Pleurochrysis_carterae.AAC.1